MKTTMTLMTLFLFILAFAAITHVVDELRQTEQRARLHGCYTNPYACSPPPVSFASLR